MVPKPRIRIYQVKSLLDYELEYSKKLSELEWVRAEGGGCF